jgi:hypothetical protein
MSEAAGKSIAWIRVPAGPARPYAAAAVGVAAALGIWFSLVLGYTLAAATLVPVLTCAVIFGRGRLFSIALPVVLPGLLAEAGPVGLPTTGSSLTALPSLLGLFLVVFVLRYQGLGQDLLPAGREHRPRGPRGAASFQVAECWLLVPALAACLLVSGWWLAWLATGSAQAIRDYRLYPHGLLAVKLVLSVFATFLAMLGLLTYLRWRASDRSEASLLLRQEMWKWCGNEQKLVARLARRHHARR